VYVYLSIGVVVGDRANPNPNPLRVPVLVENLSLLPFNVTFRDKMLKIKQLLCASFTTRDIIGSDTARGRLTRCLSQAKDTLATPLSIGVYNMGLQFGPSTVKHQLH